MRCWSAIGLVTLLAAACASVDRREDASDGLIEPDVFEVMRSSNRRAVIEGLRAQAQQEREQARLLQLQIEKLEAAEEGLAYELLELEIEIEDLREEVAEANDVRDQLRLRLEEAKTVGGRLEGAEAEADKAALEELVKKLEARLSGSSAGGE